MKSQTPMQNYPQDFCSRLNIMIKQPIKKIHRNILFREVQENTFVY